ncbi:MAG: hypothetical protein AAF960_27610 [Bacteroidota bacterium]
MKRSILWSTLILFCCSNFIVHAQIIDLGLRFNPTAFRYEVFAKPNFTKDGFLISAGSQISVVIPQDFANQPLKAVSTNRIVWIDAHPVYQPANFPNSDIHSFVAQGGSLSFQKNDIVPLFSFQLPVNYDHKMVRLFVNQLEASYVAPSENIGNYLANGVTFTDFYRANFSQEKEAKGILKDRHGYPIENAQVKVGPAKTTTLYDGRFAFEQLAVGDELVVEFQHELSPKISVTTADLIRLQQHLSGYQPFDQPYQFIAADLDNSGTITDRDAELLEALIGSTSAVPALRFLPTAWLNNRMAYQKTIPTQLSILRAERQLEVAFTAIKLGDVDGSYAAKANAPTKILPSAKTLTINILNEEIKAGQPHFVAFSTDDFKLLTAYQATLKIEEAAIVRLENTFDKQPGLSLQQLAGGKIVARWLNSKTKLVKQVKNSSKSGGHQSATEILELEIVPKKDGLVSDFITLLDEPIRTEAYDENGRVMALQLLFKNAPKEIGQLEMYQNQPNPFREKTAISYFLPQDGTVKLSLSNESGTILKRFEVKGKKGFNSFNISSEILPKGLIYYKIDSDFGAQTKKMLHLN